MPRVTCLMARLAPLFSAFAHSPRAFFSPRFVHNVRRHSLTTIIISSRSFSMDTKSHLGTLAQTPNPNDDRNSTKLSSKARRKAANESPEGVLKHKLNECSKVGDVVQALRLYDEARKNGVLMNLDHYNKLLYLCSVPNSDLGLERGFEIFQQMLSDGVVPNEATFTNAARLAAAKEDPEMAFELLRRMKDVAVAPKLRSFGPALYGFCKRGDADRAYQVDAGMIESGIVAEEPELSALLEVSVGAKKEDKVYEMLHRLRATVRQVSESTLQVIEDWFNSEYATKIGRESWDDNEIREGIARGGGGWHGQGWLGSGRWKVVKTQVNDDGMCLCCGEKLVSIDIDPKETENFAASLSKLACQKEVKANFNHFQKWLQQHGPFDAVVDGANMGLANTHPFSFSQLSSVVQKLQQMSPSKRLPLIILHISRVAGGPAQNPNNRRLIENWKKNGALYATPQGSNDDWYWLYAAVSCKCLLLTNDEMRDHLFQLLGSSFFPRWKERHQSVMYSCLNHRPLEFSRILAFPNAELPMHLLTPKTERIGDAIFAVQVRLSASTGKPSLILPPSYSIVIQESANGSWHVPTVTGDDLEIPRTWLCATRSRKKSLHNLWTYTSASYGT